MALKAAAVKQQKNPYIHNSGSESARIWVVVDVPFDSDIEKGYLYSGGGGYVYRKMLADAGISNYRIVSRRPDLEHPDAYSIVENDLNHSKPPIVIACDDAATWLCPSELTPRSKSGKPTKKSSNLEDYQGSLLRSSKLNYEHYVIPAYGPKHVIQQWKERDLITSLDLGKAKLELDYWLAHQRLQPLPTRNLRYEFDFHSLISVLRDYRRHPVLSVDIETIYNKIWMPTSYPITLGIAPSPWEGIAFPMWNWSIKQIAAIWRELDYLFRTCQILGQNIQSFDEFHTNMLGFEFVKTPLDTKLAHAILWPELPHDLGFMVRQYTREPFHKDSGSGWSMSNLKPLLRYNALDCCTTFECWLGMQEELKARPQLAA